MRASATGQTAALQQAGRVIQLDGERIGVVTGDAVLALHEVQLAGKRVMSIDEFVRGHPQFVGAVLGNSQ